MAAHRAFFQGAAGLVVLLLLCPFVAYAQQGLMTQELLQQLNQKQETTPINPATPLPSPVDQLRTESQPGGPQNRGGRGAAGSTGAASQPALQRQDLLQMQLSATPPALSPIETDYSRRAGMPLSQYGYDVFRTILPSGGQLQTGAVANNYRLSIGDELVITLQGQASRSLRTRVDSEGRVVIPDIPPVPAAGRTFGEVRGDIEREVATRFLNTNVFVSVANVRQIAVSVLGEANAPGIYRMGGFGTALDALAMAGGVKSTGSLRRIMLVRGKTTTTIDLYDVMAGLGGAPDLSLADGDRLTIPPIGPTVAVAGEVVRPGIYELSRADAIAGQSLLALAGGALRPTGNRFLRLALDAGGRNTTTELASLAQQTLHAGDILLVRPRDDAPAGSVMLVGHVRVPGLRSLAADPDLRRLIGSADAFLPSPYLLFGVVETTDPQTRARRLVPVDLADVMSGRTNVQLKNGDVVIVLSVGDVHYLASADVQAVLEGRPPPLLRQRIVTKNPRAVSLGAFAPGELALHPGPAAAQLLAQGQAAQATLAGQQDYAQQIQTALQTQFPVTPPPTLPAVEQQRSAGPVGANPQEVLASPVQRDFLAEQSAQICRGLQELAAIAANARPGRFTNAVYSPLTGQAADLASRELGRYDLSRIQDEFPCPLIFESYPDLLPLVVEYATTVEGAVRIPGPYPILPGTPMSDIVSEAGGLTSQADFKRVEVTHYAIGNDTADTAPSHQLIQIAPTQLASLAVSPGDVVRFNPLFTDRDSGLVALIGEFRRPGSYDIVRGEHLSQLIARAGGLTAEAYPYGAVFTRLSVRAQERQEFIRASQQLQSGLTTAVAKASTNEQSQALALTTQQLVTQLRDTEPVGRVVVEADPTVLQVKPELDPLMVPGDSVLIPKRPFYVAVAGEVLNPTSLQFRPGATPRDYIEEAGGFTQSAEDDSVFVLLPNGRAQPVQSSFWNFTSVEVPPGSTVIVPKNLSPFDLTTFLKDSTQVLSQLAISAASLAVLQNNSTR